MKRVLILLLDSLGVGAGLDANRYGDNGANTFTHVVQHRLQNNKPVNIPNLVNLGLPRVALSSSGILLSEYQEIDPISKYGYAIVKSAGKDSVVGHLELSGIIREQPWGTFVNKQNSFPKELLRKVCSEANLPGTLANCHSEGVAVINEYGQEHLASGKPILYTSVDSVLQIAAHEEYFGLEKLYDVCQITRKYVDEYDIARVIARPFIGEYGSFVRTANRRDFTLKPHNFLLEYLVESGVEVHSVGKVSDIFAHHGITQSYFGENNKDKLEITLRLLQDIKQDALIFVNLADFDTEYGHRRDPDGYASALEEFDNYLPRIQELLSAEDYGIITGDHGCDPTFKGHNHTKEHVPVLLFGPNIVPEFIGRRETLADVGQTVARSFNIRPLDAGVAIM